MSIENTAQVLANITDVGLFERLATAILREANPVYSSLVHTGVNVDGKTVVSPLDGICFVNGAEPPVWCKYSNEPYDIDIRQYCG